MISDRILSGKGKNMKKGRAQRILDALQRCKFISTEYGCEYFKASAATIRRDFNELAAAGLVCRTHGGIKSLDADMAPSVPIGLRGEWNTDEKQKLAEHAANLIGKGDSVMIYGGSTTQYTGLYINHGTIITNLPAICTQLVARFPTGDGPHVILTGGLLDYRTGNLQGPAALASVERYSCDIGISSAFGMDEVGLNDINDECVSMIQAMMRRSRKKIVLADHTKFQRRAICRAIGWEEIDMLITTPNSDNLDILNIIRGKGVNVVFP